MRNGTGNKVLTTSEVAMLLGISTGTLRNWRMAGNGPKWHKLGEGKQAQCFYRLEDVVQFQKLREKNS